MKLTIKQIFLYLCAVLLCAGCDPDGDLITTDGPAALTLEGSGDAVLDKDHLDALALTLHWTDNSRLTLSDDAVQAPLNATENTVQFAAAEDFATTVDMPADDGATSMQFTVESLNSLVGRLGLEGGVAAPVYIRVRSVLAQNMSEQYSNVYKVNITPYAIDMTVGYILNKDKADTGLTLYSLNADGVYSGFHGVTAWYNFWLQEGNGTVWGNDGKTGTPFLISSEDDAWNFWYPGQDGCYYTIINTQRQEWSALYVKSLTVSGDISGEMEYNKKSNKWTLSFTAASAGTKKVRISGSALQYNKDTGTDDANAIATSVAFGQTDGKITFGSEATDLSVNVPASGATTLVLDLSNPKEWTLSTGDSEPDTPSAAACLWLVGVDDGATGAWNFDQSIPLTDEENLTYAGAVNVNSLWGYRLYTEKDSWSGFYGKASGDASEGTLVAEQESNIDAPTAGLYVVEASLSAMTYKTTAVNSVQITGINDDWSLTQMTPTAEPGVYTAQVAVTADTPWGYKIVLNDNWDTFFGGTSGQMLYLGGNIPLDELYKGGTWTFTVDLCKGTITITDKK